MTYDDESKAWMKRVAHKSGSKIKQSSVFMSLFTGNFEKDPQCALELGIAILLDKPILLLAPKGTKIPRALERAATGISFYNPDDPKDTEEAAKRLLNNHRTANDQSPI